eukprot:gene8081-8275_t
MEQLIRQLEEQAAVDRQQEQQQAVVQQRLKQQVRMQAAHRHLELYELGVQQQRRKLQQEHQTGHVWRQQHPDYQQQLVRYLGSHTSENEEEPAAAISPPPALGLAAGGGVHLEIEEQGVRRDAVLDGMKRRLQHTLMQHAAVGRPYNWVLLQGGINDLTGPSTTSAPEVMAGLEELVHLCLAHGASVMLMTLLEAPSAEAALQEQCQQLNKLIRAFVANKAWEQPTTAAAGSQRSDSRPVTAEIRMRGAAAAAAAGGATKLGDDAGGPSTSPLRPQPTVALCDLATYLPYSELTEQERWELWHNDTQLTVDGYDAVGLLLFNSLAPRVKRQLATRA